MRFATFIDSSSATEAKVRDRSELFVRQQRTTAAFGKTVQLVVVAR
jgi:hypothetical protein